MLTKLLPADWRDRTGVIGSFCFVSLKSISTVASKKASTIELTAEADDKARKDGEAGLMGEGCASLLPHEKDFLFISTETIMQCISILASLSCLFKSVLPCRNHSPVLRALPFLLHFIACAIALIQLQEDMKRLLIVEGNYSEEELEEYMQSHKKLMIDSLWKLNVADIEATLSRVCQMVLQDNSVKKEELRAQ